MVYQAHKVLLDLRVIPAKMEEMDHQANLVLQDERETLVPLATLDNL